MNHIATLPLVSRQRMSPLPSPLKSPVPTIDHAMGAFPTPARFLTSGLPISQIATLPLGSCQRMSLLPSPSKSRCPTIDQLVGTAPIPVEYTTCVLFISHTAVLPAVSRQAMSLHPSPFKSWVLFLTVLVDRTKTHAAPMPELSLV